MSAQSLWSWMTDANTGNRPGIEPARMAGSSVGSELRFARTEASPTPPWSGRGLQSSDCRKWSARVHGGALALLLFLLMTVGSYAGDPPTAGKNRPTQPQSALPTTRPSPAPKPQYTQEELEAAYGMESMLADLLIQEMRKTVHESELFPRSNAEKIYQQMLDQEYSRELGRAGTFGIAEQVLAELRRRK